MKIYFPDSQRCSCHRPPDWRWCRAGWLVERGKYFSQRRDDADTGQAVRYFRALARSRRSDPGTHLLQRFPDVHAARVLHERAGASRLVVQARLLARQTPDETAPLTGIPARVIDVYEKLFFHCRDRLEARDWVLVHGIGRKRSAEGKDPDPSIVLKSFAYFGGPAVLEAVLPYLLGGRDRLDAPLDLATPQGRCEQVIRLAVAAQLLPQGAATDRKLQKIMLILLKSARQQPLRQPPVPFLAHCLDFRLQELLAGALSAHGEQEARAVPAANAALLAAGFHRPCPHPWRVWRDGRRALKPTT
jgi:hypothetical protein